MHKGEAEAHDKWQRVMGRGEAENHGKGVERGSASVCEASHQSAV